MAGLTLQQLQSMGATSTPPTKGLTKEQLLNMGATPTNNAGEGNSIQRATGQTGVENTTWFDYNPEDSTIKSTGKMVGNIIPSLYGLGKGIVSAVAHPVQTFTGIRDLVAGTAATGAKYALDHTDMGNSIKESLNNIRMANGVESLKRDENGHLIVEDTEEMKKAQAVGGYFKDRYGSAQGLAKTVVEDPAGIALDVSSLFSGGASLAGKGAKLAEVANMGKTAETLAKVSQVTAKAGEITNPIANTVKLANKTVVPYSVSKAKDVTEFLKTPAQELKTDAMAKGIESMTDSLKGVKNKFNKTTFIQTLDDGTKVKVDPITTFTEKGYVPDVTGGKVNVDKIKSKIASEMEGLNTEIDTKLAGVETPIKIDDFAKKIEEAIKNNEVLKDGGKVSATLNKLKGFVDDLKMSYGDEIPVSRVNNIRKVANRDFNLDTIDLSRMIGDAGREIVYNATPDLAVKKLLTEQRKLINADTFASAIQNHAVKGGRLGNYVFSTLGAIIGGATKLPFGVGEMAGAVGGRALSEMLQARQFKSLPADVKGGLEKVLGKFKNEKIPETQVKQLELPAPSYEKSPNNQPVTNTANNTNSASIENIISHDKEILGNKENYVYHITPKSTNINSIKKYGIKPSEDGYAGEGVYMANTPENTLYYLDSVDDGTLIRIDKQKLIDKYGLYSKENKTGIQYDSEHGEVLLDGNRNVPPEFLDISNDGGRTWSKLLDDTSGGDSEGGLSKVLGKTK